MAGGMRGINPRQMQRTMRSMGIKQTPIENVTEVIIRTRDRDIVIKGADVVCIDMKGSKSYQVSGQEEILPAGSSGGSTESAITFSREDIELVMGQTGCDEAKAVEALEATDGQPAEAIVSIMSE